MPPSFVARTNWSDFIDFTNSSSLSLRDRAVGSPVGCLEKSDLVVRQPLSHRTALIPPPPFTAFPLNNIDRPSVSVAKRRLFVALQARMTEAAGGAAHLAAYWGGVAAEDQTAGPRCVWPLGAASSPGCVCGNTLRRVSGRARARRYFCSIEPRLADNPRQVCCTHLWLHWCTIGAQLSTTGSIDLVHVPPECMPRHARGLICPH